MLSQITIQTYSLGKDTIFFNKKLQESQAVKKKSRKGILLPAEKSK